MAAWCSLWLRPDYWHVRTAYEYIWCCLSHWLCIKKIEIITIDLAAGVPNPSLQKIEITDFLNILWEYQKPIYIWAANKEQIANTQNYTHMKIIKFKTMSQRTLCIDYINIYTCCVPFVKAILLVFYCVKNVIMNTVRYKKHRWVWFKWMTQKPYR